MPWVFNPFTGKLDQTGSGGGGNPFDQDLNTTDSPSFTGLGVGTTTPIRKYHQVGGKFLIESTEGGFGQFQFVNPSSGEASLVMATNSTPLGDGGISNNADDPSYIWGVGIGAFGTSGNYFGIGNASHGICLGIDASGNASISGTLTVGGTPLAAVALSGAYSDLTGTPNLASYVTLTGVQTLTNKTLTAPSISNGSSSATLTADAANVLAQRFGPAAQSFRLYNTFTDASNYERGVFDWTSTTNTLTIGTARAGTGAARDVRIRSQNNVDIFALDTTQVASFRSGVTILYTPLQFVPTTKAGAATTSDLSSGRAGLFKNSTDGSVRLWINDGGTMKSVALT